MEIRRVEIGTSDLKVSCFDRCRDRLITRVLFFNRRSYVDVLGWTNSGILKGFGVKYREPGVRVARLVNREAGQELG